MRPDIQKVLVVVSNGRQEEISNANPILKPDPLTQPYEPSLKEAANNVKAKGMSFKTFFLIFQIFLLARVYW